LVVSARLNERVDGQGFALLREDALRVLPLMSGEPSERLVGLSRGERATRGGQEHLLACDRSGVAIRSRALGGLSRRGPGWSGGGFLGRWRGVERVLGQRAIVGVFIGGRGSGDDRRGVRGRDR